MGLSLGKLFLSSMKAVLIFHHEHKKTTCNVYCQNLLVLSGLHLLVAFPKHSGELYEQSGALLYSSSGQPVDDCVWQCSVAV